MLFNIFLVGAMATLGSSLPQAPAAAAPGPVPLPSFLPVRPDTPPNFRLLEHHSESAHNQDHYTSCWNDDLAHTRKEPDWQTNMLKCLDQYNAPNWDGQDCGGVGWFKASISYQNPQDCYNACKGCMDWFIDSNSTNGYCWNVHGPVTVNWGGGAPYAVNRQIACDMGYH